MSEYKKAGYKAICLGDDQDTVFRVIDTYDEPDGELVVLSRDNKTMLPFFTLAYQDQHMEYALSLPNSRNPQLRVAGYRKHGRLYLDDKEVEQQAQQQLPEHMQNMQEAVSELQAAFGRLKNAMEEGK